MVVTSTPTRPLRLLAVTHGSPSMANRESVIRLVDAVASARPEVDVAVGFVDAAEAGRGRIGSLAGPEEDAAVIVPLVLSAGFHVRTGLTQRLERSHSSAGLAAALGPDDRIVEVIAMRLERCGLAGDDAVVLAAAGSNDPRAQLECFETGRRLAVRLGRSVTVGFIAAGVPRLRDAVDMIREVHPARRVVVVPYLLAPGVFCDAASGVGADVVAAPLLVPDEPAPAALVDLVLARYDEVPSDQGLGA